MKEGVGIELILPTRPLREHVCWQAKASFLTELYIILTEDLVVFVG